MFADSTILKVSHRIAGSWRILCLTDLVFKVFSFVVLAPLLGICQRLTIWAASDGLLSDADFVYLLSKPVGIACSLLVTSVWLAIIALEQASLLAIFESKEQGKTFHPMAAIRFSIGNARGILGLTALLALSIVAVLLPVALIALAVYTTLLGHYDINFYLSQKPTEFVWAIGIGTVLLVSALAFLFWIHSAWLLSLPIAIFERKKSRSALRESHALLHGKRWRVLEWLVLWSLGVFLANALLAGVASWAARLLIPSEISSLVTLATRVGILLLVMAVLSLVINLIATISFAAFLHTGYRSLRAYEGFLPELESPSRGSNRIFVVTSARLALGLGIGLLLAAWLGICAFARLPLEDHALVMAHRGASSDAPENTMAAFQMAIEQKADWIELDVQESVDGQVIVMHDSDFMKQSNKPTKVWEASEEQLAQIDIGSWVDKRFADERVPTLREVLELCSGKVGVNIELKYYGHDQQLEQRVIDIVESLSMSDQVMLMSLKKKGVMKARALRPDWKCGLLLSVFAGDLESLDVDFLAINSKFASRSFVRRAHAAGKEVFVWTVNDAASMSQMLNRGVDGLLTDRPELAKRVLRERAAMSVPERLLSELSVWLLGANDISPSDDLETDEPVPAS